MRPHPHGLQKPWPTRKPRAEEHCYLQWVLPHKPAPSPWCISLQESCLTQVLASPCVPCSAVPRHPQAATSQMGGSNRALGNTVSQLLTKFLLPRLWQWGRSYSQLVQHLCPACWLLQHLEGSTWGRAAPEVSPHSPGCTCLKMQRVALRWRLWM